MLTWSSLCSFLCFNFHYPKLGIRHAIVCSSINTCFGRGAQQIKKTVHKSSTSGFYYDTVLYGSVTITPKTTNHGEQTQETGLSTGWSNRWGVIHYTLTTCITRKWWRKGMVEGKENTKWKFEAKRQRTDELPGPTSEPLRTSTTHVHCAVSFASTFTTQS